MADDLPIDIDYAKFLDWLLDRRRVSRGWHASLKAARVLLRSAADALPAGAALPAPTSYYSLLAALAAVEDTSLPPPFPGARDTDMLNRYSHPTSRAWSSARASYESGAAFLAEAAQALVRATDVEAPAIRTEVARLRETIADCARKEGPATRAAADARARFCAACEELGVAGGGGADFEREIRATVDADAPALLREVVAAAKDARIAAGLAHYAAFTAYVCASEVPGDEGGGDGNLCAALAAVVDGDVDALTAPAAVVAVEGAGDGDGGGGGIDWGSSVAADAGEAGGGIDWGIEIDASGAEMADDTAPSASGGGGGGDGDGGGGIDWGDTVGPAVGEAVGAVAGAAGGGSVTLADAAVRSAFINDLVELQAFLAQREVELSRSSDSQASLAVQQAGGVPDGVRRVDAAAVGALRAAAAAVLAAVGGPRARRVLALAAGGDAVVRAGRALGEKKHAAARLEGGIAALAARKEAASAELRSLEPRFEALAAEARATARRTEAALSAMYKGREVNILGEMRVVFGVDE